MTLVVVGGGPAGLSAIRTFREAGGRGAVTLVTAEPHLPYERPPLTKDYLRTGEGREELPLEDAAWFAKHEVEVRHAPVTRVGLDGSVELQGGDVLPFDRLVLATGSEPQRPPLPGVDLDGVHVIRSLDDAEAIRARVAAGARRVVVVGSGFIGCEAAASLAGLGCAVTMVSGDPAPQAARLGEAAGRELTRWLEGAGIALRFGARAASLREGLQVVCDDDSPALDADLVVLGAGAKPRVELAEAAGLEMRDGAVRCDASLRTSHPNVWAAGDIAMADHPRAGRGIRVEHWGDALAHGEAIGAQLAGSRAQWEDVPGFWSTIGDRTLKLAAWGDGWDTDRLVSHPGGGFTVWYERDGACVGVLTHEADEDYERGGELVAEGAPAPA